MQYINKVPAKIVRWSLTVAVLCSLLLAPAAADDPRSSAAIEQAHQQETAQLLKLLESDALTAKKAAAFERLAVVGSSEAIEVLAKLLADEQLAHYARFSLEPIPDPAVDEVFRAALEKLEGRLLVGVVNSIGVRKDAKAVESLGQLLAANDLEVVGAAAKALGCIANSQSAEVLTKALADGQPKRRAGVAIGAVVCAENMAKQEMSDQATALFDQIRNAEVPANIRLAGLRGAILVRGKDGLSLMVEQLDSEDSDVVNVALRTARELGGRESAQALIAKLDSLSAAKKARVVLVLGDLGNAAALPAVAAAAESESMLVRLAAIASLKNLGDVTVVPLLWQAAAAPDPALSQAAEAALGNLPGDQVDAAIVAKLDSRDRASRELAVTLIGERRIKVAVPALLEVANTTQGSLQLAAVKALGETVALDGLSDLIDRVISARGDAQKSATREALTATCARMSDRDSAAKILAGRVSSAPDDVKRELLVQLGAIGGDAALDQLVAGARDSDPVVQDKATELLGKWVGSDIGPALLDLVKTLDNQKYRIRLLRGYIRLAKQFGLPPDETMTICRNALAVAERVQEKQEVFKVLARNPSPDSLAVAVSQLSDPELKNEAASYAVLIAEQVVHAEPQAVVEPLGKLLKANVPAGLKKRAQAVLKDAKAKVAKER